jgi:hypothetical protein
MNLQKIALIVFALAIATGMASVLSYGEELSGDQIMQRVDNRDDGDDLIQKIYQKLIDKRGGVRERHIVSFRKDYGKDSKAISYFLKPANIRDTALLTYDYDGVERDDDQWLYLPALKNVFLLRIVAIISWAPILLLRISSRRPNWKIITGR